MKKYYKFIWGLFGVSLLANLILIFMIIHTNHKRRTHYIQSMSAVTEDLYLADLSLNQHKKVSGTPVYLISAATGILHQDYDNSSYPHWSNEYGLIITLGNTEYYIEHPKGTTQAQYESAKAFVRTLSKELRATQTPVGYVDFGKVQTKLKQISKHLPSELRYVSGK